MANATSKAECTTTPYSTTMAIRGLGAVAATYYTGTMICIDPATGYAVKAADTSGLIFDGIACSSPSGAMPLEVLSTDSAGDKKIYVDKPRLLTMKIASAAITDVGRKVYALYDNEVAYSTSNSVLVGVVEAYVDSTSVQVRPYWTSTSGVNAFDGEELTFTGATTANQILMPDNLADALSISEGSTEYLTFVTTNSSEQLLIKKKTSFLDAIDLIFGTGLDAAMRWSTGDASDHSLVLALGDTSQMLHITDLGAIATDWAVTSPTHPNVYIHSNTTPATDYLRLGDHDGTEADIDVVGGTSLALKIAGTEYASVRVTGLAAGTYVAAATPGTDQLTLKSTGTAPASTGANVGHLYADFETDDDELFWLSGTGGTATQLTT